MKDKIMELADAYAESRMGDAMYNLANAECIELRAENQRLRLDAERYRALTNNCRSKYIWNNVFTDDQRDLGNDVESVLDALAALGEKT